MSNEWLANSKVRFTKERLAILTPRDRQGLAGRIGVTQTDCRLVVKPTVYFPAVADKPELRLFRVDPRHLELVEGPPEPVTAQAAPDSTNRPDLTSPSSEAPPAATDSGGKMSQEDLDNFFD